MIKRISTAVLAFILSFSMLLSLPFNAQAKSYAGYDAVIDDFYGYNGAQLNGGSTCTYAGYRYFKIPTRYGKQKALFVELVGSICSETRIFIKQNKTGKAVKLQTLKGTPMKYSKSKKAFVTQEHVTTGVDVYRLYKYNKSKKKFVKAAESNCQYGSRFPYEITTHQALKKLEKKGKVKMKNLRKVRGEGNIIF